MRSSRPSGAAWVDLYWLPLGAGGHVVRWNGRVYEWWSARREHRAAADLYHCGLMVCLDGVTYAVEMGPVWNVSDAGRGVVAEGPVGATWLGRFRAFRYEVRCWPGGRIPDVAEAVESPVRANAQATAELEFHISPAPSSSLPQVRTGISRNIASTAATVAGSEVVRTGHDMDTVVPPQGGRAPGWTSGLVLAHRQATVVAPDPDGDAP